MSRILPGLLAFLCLHAMAAIAASSADAGLEKVYQAASAAAAQADYKGLTQDVVALCRQVPPRADDLPYRLACAASGPEPAKVKAALIQTIAELAFQADPDRNLGYHAYTRAGDLLYLEGHLHDAIRMYEKAFSVLPVTADTELQAAKINLAVAYASPLLSKTLQRKSLQYYEEIRSWYDRRKHDSEAQRSSKWISYNKGIAELFLFRNYQTALEDFSRVHGYASFEVDASVFAAYAAAQLQQKELARQHLNRIDLAQIRDSKRRDFLKCYRELSLRLLGDQQEITSCLNLHDPQADVLLDLTQTLQTLGLNPSQENLMWRKFYNSFSQHMLPDIQDALSSASAEVELAQARSESRVNELKLKNLSLYQTVTYTLVGIVLALALTLVLSVSLWRSSRRHAREMMRGQARLQHILDSIEEAIITILPNLTLEPQDSPHLVNILGARNLRESGVQELLDLMELPADRQAIARECLQASLGEDAVSWDMNCLNLPAETQIQGRTIALFWQPMIRKGVVRSVLLVMRDVTIVRRLEQQSSETKAHADRLIQHAHELLSVNPKAASRFLQGIPEVLLDLKRLIQVKNEKAEALRVTHTLKGTARTLGLTDLQEHAHKLEDELKSTGSTLPRGLEALNDIVRQYAEAWQHVAGGRESSHAQTILEIVANLKPALRKQLEAAGVALTKLSVMESMDLAPDELQTVQDILMHGLTNAADHGFVHPASKGVSRTAEFEITLTHDPAGKTLAIRDNGAGINHQALQTMAKARGWQPRTDQTWTDFLFMDGVTTTKEVSSTSGRGVGLAAIRHAAGRLGGHVCLLDNDQGSGAWLRVQWPSSPDAKIKPDAFESAS